MVCLSIESCTTACLSLQGDYVFMQARRKRLHRYEHFLKKFKYKDALSSALKVELIDHSFDYMCGLYHSAAGLRVEADHTVVEGCC